tara:strand:- start:3586 stop:4248 length:663 start_codon:yes stop_codon:yes gene_type:complete
MSKKWTQHDSQPGLSVSPRLVNDEIRAQQSSATTIDRAQMPEAWVDDDDLKDYAIHQVWQSNNYPTGGEQTGERDTGVTDAAWNSSTIQVQSGGWQNVSTTALTLAGFKGGNLFCEWSCNAYVNNIFARGINDGKPGSPNYMRLRIVINGVTICERRGASTHQTTRLTMATDFPPGDLSVQLQYKLTAPSEDAASTDNAGKHVPYGHIWNSRYFFLGRYR